MRILKHTEKALFRNHSGTVDCLTLSDGRRLLACCKTLRSLCSSRSCFRISLSRLASCRCSERTSASSTEFSDTEIKHSLKIVTFFNFIKKITNIFFTPTFGFEFSLEVLHEGAEQPDLLRHHAAVAAPRHPGLLRSAMNGESLSVWQSSPDWAACPDNIIFTELYSQSFWHCNQDCVVHCTSYHIIH